MTTLRTARERARAEVRAEILAAARHQLAVDGAAGLSLRAVARDLGMVSSALYRYFDSRDALLTALIVEAYDALGDAAEAAAVASVGWPPAEKWTTTATAVREWALARPHEYGLLYGSPVPGYAAPDATVVPGTRVSLALLGIVRDAHRDGLLRPAPVSEGVEGWTGADGPVAAEITTLAGIIAPELPAPVLFAALLAWTQLFGLLSFELFGQTRGVVADHGAFFRSAVRTMGTAIGL